VKREPFTPQDSYIMAGAVLLTGVSLNYALLGNGYVSEWRVFLPATAGTFAMVAGTYLVCGRIAIFMRNRYPHYRQTPVRLALSLGAFALVTTSAITGTLLGYAWLGLPGYTFHPTYLRWALLIGFVTNVVVTAIQEGFYTFELWRKTLTETEQLRKANLQSQFESLKQQINPHFLFNSLNSLSSLIEEDPKQAEVFLDELSSVYRYLLRANESELTTLGTELDFVRSYFYLLRIRYGEGIRLEQRVSDAFMEYLIPPLTLQLLIENAVKHNAILPDQPLTIEILTTKVGRLVVRNNLQRRSVRVPSNRVGLSNIATKYHLLGQGEVSVNEDDRHFTVVLPLLPASHLVS
jgi:sensor histidine kinase YesM